LVFVFYVCPHLVSSSIGGKSPKGASIKPSKNQINQGIFRKALQKGIGNVGIWGCLLHREGEMEKWNKEVK